MSEQQGAVTPEDEKKLLLKAARACAVGEAMREVMAERREEIIKRARAKLTAMGINLEPEDVQL